MRKFYFIALISAILACGTGKSRYAAADSANAGNSDGGNTIGTDTSHMDTGTHSISTDR